jgi:hypothetical protein
MRFLIHGDVRPGAVAALAAHEHVCGTLPELLAAAETPAQDHPDLPELLTLLQRRQWNLLTTDGELVRNVYDKKAAFDGLIVLILEAATQDQAGAIRRLLERYRRLTPGRLYTITPSRVKIRQLPGAAQRNP